MNESLERRAREIRARQTIRSWEYRQRNHANGVWYRLRRLLSSSAEAYEISAEEAARLTTEGYRADPVGAELEPPRRYVVVPASRIASIADRRRLIMRLDAELLAAEHVALVPFDLAS